MNYSVLAVDSNDISVSIYNANDKTVGTSFISIVKGGWDLVSDFRQNPLGTIVSIIMEFLGGVADAIQWVDNLIQTGEFTNVLNSYDYLSDSDSDEDNLNKYTNVGDYEKGAKSVYGIDISKDENGNGKDTGPSISKFLSLGIAGVSLRFHIQKQEDSEGVRRGRIRPLADDQEAKLHKLQDSACKRRRKADF